MSNLFKESPQIIIKQIKEVFEIAINWETANKYALYDSQKNKIGFAAERSLGILHKIIRNIMRSHRSIVLDIWDNNEKHIYTGKRPWYFFFSDLEVYTSHHIKVGDIKTRFGLLKRKYDLIDSTGKTFVTIESYRFRLWTFTIYDTLGNKKGVITKKWGGFLKEVFTDSDQFLVDYSQHNWSEDEKAIILFSALSIDLDFFEDNSSSALDLFGN